MKRYFVLEEYNPLKKRLRRSGYKADILVLSDTKLLEVNLDFKDTYDLSKHIFDSVRERLIEGIIRRHISNKLSKREYPMFDSIFEKSISYMEDEHIECKVIGDIREYIESSELTNIDGFINFRLRYYSDLIEDSIERALYDIELEIDYKKLIKTIRYISEIQTRKEESIDIVFSENSHIVLDSDGNRIEETHILDEVLTELGLDDINEEESIIGSLIDRAPKKIRIYKEDDIANDTVNSIKEIFGERVEVRGPYGYKLRLVSENI